MVMAPCKCLILLALLLSFFFFTASGRSFGVMESDRRGFESGEKGEDSKLIKGSDHQDHGGVPPEEEVGDLSEMDYTPPRKKPPIHN